ncbi:hypothetical protein B0H66DRAFT_469691 [Apodospora peruviana]|uniref:Calpain catalytic domain-containing protein n=1 Tax=Apodospora peruviana TaxID=516989 RepID=A0AAE0ITX3_9PEZI|nr:hypothetical protein B0H66DRAFT_469691 [Apodospora peruviana]
MTATKPNQPDAAPKSLYVGAINPFALVEAMLGRKVDWSHAPTADIISNVLQSDYDELFDMKYESVLYAGIRLNGKNELAEQVPSREMHTLTERDMVTPDFSAVEKLSDLHEVGMKDLGETKVKHAYMLNGNLRLILRKPRSFGKTLSNSGVTTTIGELATPFRHSSAGQWTPPNSSWEDISSYLQHQPGPDPSKFNHPVQGAIGNSWLVAALMSVAWTDPSAIVHCNRSSFLAAAIKKEPCHLSVRLYSKGGDNDAPTTTVDVNCEVPVHNASNMLMYCRSSGGNGYLWPALYEKAFTKWISRDGENRPDITQSSHGDPVKAMAQLTDKDASYFFTAHRSDRELMSIVRSNSVNFRTVYPMCAFTYPTGDRFRGCNLVANMAYSVLGWTASPQDKQKQYVILRHPWGVTEPEGLNTSYPGLVVRVDASFWQCADMIESEGVFALEMGAFKEYFAGLGVAK